VGYDLRDIDPDCVYHVNCRGCNRGPIAWDRHDYASLFAELDRAAMRYGWDVFAWCFMPNHHHEVLRTPHGGFSEGFQLMNGVHSRRTNRRHGRTDHLFRHRPRAKLVDSDAYFAGVVPYVLRNPVAAGLCEDAAAWPYSSYRATMGLEPAPPWLRVEEVLSYYGSNPTAARAEFARIVREGPVPVSNTSALPSALAAAATPG
jgi:REP element-mobilizing transposase RayT